MLQESEQIVFPKALFLDQEKRNLLREEVLKAAFRFSKLFSRMLYRSFELLVVNTSKNFLSSRDLQFQKKILCAQFFLTKKIEEVVLETSGDRQLFLKLFRGPSRISVAVACSLANLSAKEKILSALDSFMPGISEKEGSFYTWQSPDLPYKYVYFELDKLRGKDFSSKELKVMEKIARDQVLASPPLTPALFWPYNKEESHRQIQLLVREMSHANDIPHVSIQFQEQSTSYLEFLVHFVRPKTSDELNLNALPNSLCFFKYFHHVIHTPFSIEIDVFSLRLEAQIFNTSDTINLLYARRFLVKQLETIIGPFRDFNGGLFEKQQDLFEEIRLQIGAKIPYFDLFAEKVFYALHPFERWLSLTTNEIEELFLTFSHLIQKKSNHLAAITPSGLFTILKTDGKTELTKRELKQNLVAYAKLTIGKNQYECFSGQVIDQIESLLKNPLKDKEILKLAFQEGSPPSLNPHYSSSDIRCKLLAKMLFEGLTRLNEKGEPVLSGAFSYSVSEDELKYTFKLREAEWSNGEMVTAFDYLESWKWALEGNVCHPEKLYILKNAEAYRKGGCNFSNVGIRVLDSETLQIVLEKKEPMLFYKLAQPFFFPLFGLAREPKWFNGPYLLLNHTKKGLKLEKNPYYWNKKGASFQNIEITYINDSESSYDLFRKTKIDWVGDPLSNLSLAQIQELDREGRLRTRKVDRRFSILFNTKHPIFSSVLIRQAFSLSVDRGALCKEFFPCSVPIFPKGYSEDLAQTLFEQALKELKLTRDSFPILNLTYSDQTRRDLLAQFMKKSWEKTFGIQIRTEKQEWNQFRSRLEKRQFEICATIEDTLEEDSVDYLDRFEGPSSYNYSEWNHPAFRQIIENAKKAKTKEEITNLKNKAQAILDTNLPFSPLFYYTHLYAAHPRLQEFAFDKEGCIDFTTGT